MTPTYTVGNALLRSACHRKTTHNVIVAVESFAASSKAAAAAACPGDFPVGWPLSVTHVPSVSQPHPCGTQSHGAAWKAALGSTGELVGVTSLP